MYEIVEIDKNELDSLINKVEDHFNDFKSKDISPAKLQETFVAFANADGGNIYIGIEDANVNVFVVLMSQKKLMQSFPLFWRIQAQ